MRERRGHPLTVRLFSKVIELDGARTGEGCHLFRRWGRIGDASRGKHILAKMHRLDAIEGFEAVFLDKTGNPWESWARHKSAVKLPGKYFPVEKARTPLPLLKSSRSRGL